MKRLFLISIAIFAFAMMWSCEDETDPVMNLQILISTNIKDSTANTVVLTAVANNAITYEWETGIDTTVQGMQVTLKYPSTDTIYVVTCTASNADSEMSVTDTVKFK